MGVDKETGDFRGYAHIEFASDGDLERALLRDGEELVGGRAMKVTYATARKQTTTKPERKYDKGRPRFKGAARRKK
jgi:nucleolin